MPGSAVSVQAPSVDQQMIAQLRAKLAGTPERMLIEKFNGCVETLRQFIPNATDLYRAALKTSGCSKNDLDIAYRGILSTIAKEMSKFKEVAKSHLQQDVTDRERDIAELDKNIAKAEDDLRTLTAAREQAEKIVMEKKNNNAQKQEAFEEAATILCKEIDEGMSTMRANLEGPNA